jgi:phosphatidylinositol glycan class V
VCLTPFMAYQYYAYKKFCPIDSMAKPVESLSGWCFKSIPLSYSYVQHKYWNVGFLNYYQFKQLPNFLLALPIISFILNNFYQYLLQNLIQIKSLAILRTNSFAVNANKRSNSLIENQLCFPHMVHVLALTLFSLLFIHIQVTTRLISSSSPVLYWAVESLVRNKSQQSFRISLVKLWFYSYFIFGILFHVNFFPFT